MVKIFFSIYSKLFKRQLWEFPGRPVVWMGFPGGSVVKNLLENARAIRDVGLYPGSGRSPGRRNGNPLQYSCQNNLMNRGSWQATVHEVAESDKTERLSTHSRGLYSALLLLETHVLAANILQDQQSKKQANKNTRCQRSRWTWTTSLSLGTIGTHL